MNVFFFAFALGVSLMLITEIDAKCCKHACCGAFKCCGQGRCNIFCCNCDGGKCKSCELDVITSVCLGCQAWDKITGKPGSGRDLAAGAAAGLVAGGRRKRSSDAEQSADVGAGREARSIMLSADADSDGRMSIQEAIAYLYKDGKVSKADAQRQKRSAMEAPLWFDEMDVDRSGFIEPLELDYDYYE